MRPYDVVSEELFYKATAKHYVRCVCVCVCVCFGRGGEGVAGSNSVMSQ